MGEALTMAVALVCLRFKINAFSMPRPALDGGEKEHVLRFIPLSLAKDRTSLKARNILSCASFCLSLRRNNFFSTLWGPRPAFRRPGRWL